ncbi:nucleotidyltransferase domain-containing protein [bacterium]|nr:nucleotidyltransferase domain-containing protein [bacterium]MBU1635033.1 nucleotidyltransferase domain-containing protein [bacterium]
MIVNDGSVEKLHDILNERVKELNCIYTIEELLSSTKYSIDEIFRKVVEAIPPGWQYPDICVARIDYEGQEYVSKGFKKTRWIQRADIIIQDKPTGFVEVYYTEFRPTADEGPFLKEERRLINTITDRLGHYLLHNKLRDLFKDLDKSGRMLMEKDKSDWTVILDFLRRSDQKLYIRFSRRMMNYLCWNGVEEAKHMLKYFDKSPLSEETGYVDDVNRPLQKATINNILQISDKTFKIAAERLSGNEILLCIQKWLQEDKSSFLVRALETQGNPLSEIADALARFYHLAQEGIQLSESTRKTLNVSLIRRFFTDQLDYINKAKNFVEIEDFYELLTKIIFLPDSHGKLGGKSAGLFLASQILKRALSEHEILNQVKIPKTWYITSDVLINYLHYNDLEEVIEQKYKEIDQIRQEYPHIIQVLKNASFPPEIVKSLGLALDDFGDSPLIVRSSSLLEDRSGSAFSGKYKSLFLANQGSREARLEALVDAISEVYASTFSPDPIEYRAERGLLDFHEEMGIMIEEVVGKKVDKYFLTPYAGVAFSNNEFRWSPRIKRDDGLIRLVPGLGTRAVDRLSDDFPILVAPGQPRLRVNVTVDELMRYSPQKMDVINLETNSFETIDAISLIREYGRKYPNVSKIISFLKGDHIEQPFGLNYNLDQEDVLITFEGLIEKTPFVELIKTVLKILEENLGTPVDIEFASDGEFLYLLQCRPQCYSHDIVASPIPKDIPEKDIVFSANRYVSNGLVPDITHLVYVVPDKYADIDGKERLDTVGEVISNLNNLLPKRQFILMGPGRWGSRGDIKLGVSVTYSDINNTAVLIEIARKKGNYLPDLSFGTHFFQDLVEASIRYLPLYPDDDGTYFNEHFLNTSPNILGKILPEFDYLSDVIRVIDIPAVTEGSVLKVLMNADLDEAVAVLAKPNSQKERSTRPSTSIIQPSDDYWRWRLQMAGRIAANLDSERFGVKAFYVFGSTKNTTAGPGSDIDLLIHFTGSDKQEKDLLIWLEGWNLCLCELNYLRTGYKMDEILDIHLVTDEDIAKKTSFAIKIGAVTDAARSLPLKNNVKSV